MKANFRSIARFSGFTADPYDFFMRVAPIHMAFRRGQGPLQEPNLKRLVMLDLAFIVLGAGILIALAIYAAALNRL